MKSSMYLVENAYVVQWSWRRVGNVFQAFHLFRLFQVFHLFRVKQVKHTKRVKQLIRVIGGESVVGWVMVIMC